MPISYNHNFKFIHIPKTGGSSVEKVFDLQKPENLYIPGFTNNIGGCWFAPQHFTHKLINISMPHCRNWFSFTITRNPYTKIISDYFFINKNFYNNEIKEFNEDKFVEWFKNELLRFDIDHKLPQSFFLDEPVNMILKFERLEEDFKQLSSYLKIEKSLIHDNKSLYNKEDIANQLSLKTRELIYTNFRKDFEAFGYSP